MPWTGEYADGGRPSFAKRSLARSSSGKKWPWSTTRQLVTSFDGCGVWRNPCHPAHAGKANVRTAQSWYHLVSRLE